MLNWFKKTYKKILLLALAVTAVVILAFSLWLLELNQQIQTSLKEKKFLPPTQFFSAPKIFSAGMKFSLKDFESQILSRQYQIRSPSDHLRRGEYALIQQGEDCQKKWDLDSVDPEDSCLVYHMKETLDPELKERGLQLLVFDAQKLLKDTFLLEPVQKAPVYLEPRLFAQYMDQEPIQQSYLSLGEMPVNCLNAVLAIEDKNFLEHSGVSYLGILRAAFRNLTGTKYAQGGSTITQQLVKNYFLNSERTLKRKFIEFFMSLILESLSSKDEILETYLNIIYLGQNGPFQVRGYPAAAEYYFEKQIQNLELQECALLAAVLNSPGLYDPFKKTENATKRRNLVLTKMSEVGFIKSEEADNAKAKPLPQKNKINVSETAPYYTDAVRKELQSLSLPTEGALVFTGLDLESQLAAQNSVRDQLMKLESENKLIKKHKESGKSLEAVLISVNNQTGVIESLVGGRGFRLTQFNRAIQGHRQVGSIMKPFVFLTALAESHSPSETLKDYRFKYEYQKQSWSPENYGGKYYGDVPMYFALKNSLNCATAKLGLEIGLEKIIETAKAAGIESKLEGVPSLTLGAFELYPMEVVQAYLTLANFGQKKNLRLIRSVLNQYGGEIYRSQQSVTEALEEIPTAQLVSMMKQTVLAGSARSIILNGFDFPAAGKTGTTSDNKDSWFAGFIPQMTTVVWVGYDDNTPHGLTGSSGAVPIWTEYMKTVTPHLPKVDFEWPRGTELRTFHFENDEINKDAVLLFRN